MADRLAMISLALLAAAPAQGADPGAANRMKAALAVPATTPQPGCAVGIFRSGKPAEMVNAGFADVAAGRAIASDTQFYAASVSKQFTAVALMQQVVAGKVALGDSVRKYVPELPAYADKVTVQMLLNMTGGIRDSLGLLSLEGYPDLSGASRAQALAGTVRQTETKFAPGTEYDYTNGGYLLLSEIVARVTGQPFEAYVNDRVLKPLGMTRSFVMLGKRTSDPNFAKGYVSKGAEVTSADEYPLFGGSGGLITTVTDLAKWDHDIDTGKTVWTPEIYRLMTAPGKFLNGAPVVRSGRGIAYGNALVVGPHWFHHTGGAGGFKTLYGRNAEKRIGIALLCNNGEIDPLKRADEVVAALNEGLSKIAEPSSPASAINGRYTTPNLAATYILAATDDTITLTIARPDGVTRPPISIPRNAQGEYRMGPYLLTPDDDARGFTLEIPRITLHFTREG